jgi:hypothetical protein
MHANEVRACVPFYPSSIIVSEGKSMDKKKIGVLIRKVSRRVSIPKGKVKPSKKVYSRKKGKSIEW